MTFPCSDNLASVAIYYADKLEQHGATAKGVDWNGEQGQRLRFDQLGKLFPERGTFSVNDLGCGFGSLLDVIREMRLDADYRGVDIAPEMIASARTRHAADVRACFEVGTVPSEPADFGVASGIFNVRLQQTDVRWFEHIVDVLEILDRTSRKGFAFNCLSSYSDMDKRRDYLFYADPCRLFDHCKRRYARNVALLHDYELYEFTILVRKPT